MAITIERKRKSQILSAENREKLKRWVEAQPTKVDAILTIGCNHGTLDRILYKGSGSPAYIEKIEKLINNQ
jgi:hypothetical protein